MTDEVKSPPRMRSIKAARAGVGQGFGIDAFTSGGREGTNYAYLPDTVGGENASRKGAKCAKERGEGAREHQGLESFITGLQAIFFAYFALLAPLREAFFPESR